MYERLRTSPSLPLVNTNTCYQSGSPWNIIKAKYAEITGNDYGHSTLPNRYERLKANFITVREEDNIIIIYAKREIETEDESTKWARIAERVVEKNGGGYDVCAFPFLFLLGHRSQSVM